MEKPQSGLKKPAKLFFEKIREDFEINDSLGLHLLALAAHHYQRILEARKIIEREGAVVLDRFDQQKEHPACSTERAASSEMRACLKQLNLDIEPLQPGPGRPGGR